MSYRPVDPRIRNNFIDSCAFDPKYSPEDEASLRIFSLYEEGVIGLNITYSNIKELEHPNTPASVKQAAVGMIYTLPTTLTVPEIAKKRAILKKLAGTGYPENMAKDSEHIFEASKYGGYFITVDERILKKREALAKICDATIVKPSEFLKIYDSYAESGER